MYSHLDTGRIGEDSVAVFLEANGHTVLDKNFRTKFGELDLVTNKAGVIHFIEVKSVVRRVGTDQLPEENVTPSKREKMSKTIQFYCDEKGIDLDKTEIVIDIAGVFIDPVTREASIRLLEDTVFE